jgi:hypothetical protein
MSVPYGSAHRASHPGILGGEWWSRLCQTNDKGSLLVGSTQLFMQRVAAILLMRRSGSV